MQVAPVTIAELAAFIQNIIQAYDSYLLYAFSLMIAFYIAVGFRRLLVGYKS